MKRMENTQMWIALLLARTWIWTKLLWELFKFLLSVFSLYYFLAFIFIHLRLPPWRSTALPLRIAFLVWVFGYFYDRMLSTCSCPFVANHIHFQNHRLHTYHPKKKQEHTKYIEECTNEELYFSMQKFVIDVYWTKWTIFMCFPNYVTCIVILVAFFSLVSIGFVEPSKTKTK